MLKRAGLDAGASDKGINFLFLQPDYPTELVRRQLPFIDELVQGTQRHPETAGRIVGRQPAEVRGSHEQDPTRSNRKYVQFP